MLIDEVDILWDVEDQHLREAEFCFGMRELRLDAAHYTLKEIGKGPERRMLAHIDALVVEGPIVAERLLVPTIEDEDEEYEKIAAATLALLAESDQTMCGRALAVLDTAEEEQQRQGVVRALQLSERAGIEDWLTQTLAGASGAGLAARLDALAGRHVVPGPWLSSYLASEEVAVARAAATLARFCPAATDLPALQLLARAEDAELRQATLESALIRHVPGAWESAVYWAFCRGESPFRRAALTWVALLGDAEAHARLLALVDDPVYRADALWAAGFCGRVAAVDRCIDLLADEDHGRLAGEVVCAIAGLPTDKGELWQDTPADNASPDETLPELEDDDLDADLVPGSEKKLPIPRPQAIRAWWQERRGGTDVAVRSLAGQPMDGSGLVTALWRAPMRRRHALAFELAVRTAGGGFVNSRALCQTQCTQLRALAHLPRVDCQRGLPLR